MSKKNDRALELASLLNEAAEMLITLVNDVESYKDVCAENKQEIERLQELLDERSWERR